MPSSDCHFSPSCEKFIHVSSDSRIHVYDVLGGSSKKKTLVDRNHLAHSYTCIAWGNTPSTRSIVAVGFSDGLVFIWDMSRGVIVQTLGVVNQSPAPTDVVFGSDDSSIFVSAQGHPVIQYNRLTGEVVQQMKVGRKGAAKLALNPKANVLVACSSSVKLIDIDSGRRKKMEASFSGGVADAQFSPCGRYLFVSSAKSRELILFDVRAGATVSPILVIPVANVLKTLDIVSDAGNDSVIGVIGCSGDAGAVVLRLKVASLDTKHQNGETNGIIPQLLSKTEISCRDDILSGKFGKLSKIRSNGQKTSTRECSSVLIATGSRSQPVFQNIDLVDENSGLYRENISFTAAPAEMLSDTLVNSNASGDALSGAVILGPHEMGGKKRPQLNDMTNAENAKRSKVVGQLDSTLLDGAGKGEDGSTLEQRLEALSSTMKQMEDYAENRGDPSRLYRAAETVESKMLIKGFEQNSLISNGNMPTTDSLVTLIDQALQSGDDTLLEQCLGCDEFNIVEETARRLATNRVVLLLRKLVAKFEKRPSRSVLLTHWLSAVLRYHTSYLVTLPDLSFQLAGLSQILEQRLGSYMKMASLAGRLDLLMSQVSYQIRGKSGQNDGTIGGVTMQTQLQPIVPLQVYREDEEKEEEADEGD